MAKAVKAGLASKTYGQYANLIVDAKAAASRFGFYSTGSPRLDKLLGGGLVKGRISEHYGREQSGKSTTALSTARGIIAAGGRVLYIDLERGLEIREPGNGGWLEKNGINAFNGTFDIMQATKDQPLPGEVMYEIMISSMREHRHQLIVLDSMAAVTTRAELAGDIGDKSFGGVAALNSQALKILVALQAVNDETHIMILNQVRDQIAGGMGGLKSTGGRALPHYAHQKLRYDKLNRSEEQPDGTFLTPIRVRSEKTRSAAASQVELTISSACGLDVASEVVEAAQETGYLVKNGAWYSLFDTPNTDAKRKDAPLFKGQGEASVRTFLADNPLQYERLLAIATDAAPITVADDEDDA